MNTVYLNNLLIPCHSLFLDHSFTLCINIIVIVIALTLLYLGLLIVSCVGVTFLQFIIDDAP